MSWQQSLELLGKLKIGKKIEHVKSETSSVTTAWGVDWNEVLVARDVMQNFYDANHDRIHEVEVSVDRGTVVISAPSTYNLERLFYLGSEKGPEDVGQYGEGFKVAATCLLRDYRVTPIALCGHDVLCMRIADEAVRGTQLYPLVYDFFRSASSCQGTQLILPGCSGKLAQALKAGLTHFLHAGNALLGDKLWSSWDEQFAVYRSTGNEGHVFYRKLKRGEIPEIAVVLVINKVYKSIENKIKRDRDRNAFGGDLMQLFYRQFARSLRYHTQAQRALVEAARPCWQRGHPLLAELAQSNSYHRSLFDKKTAKTIFGDKYFARSTARETSEQLRYNRMESEWQQEGRQCLPGYFENFGVPSAHRYLLDLAEKARSEAHRSNSRPPTQAEVNSLLILKEILGELAPAIAGIVSKNTTYTVTLSDAILGELKEGRHYRSREVYLAADVFAADFPEALAVFLHEHAHIFGYDGSRGFTDALTELLETVIRYRKELDVHESRWLKACKAVAKERRKGKEPSKNDTSVDEQLASLRENELRVLLRGLPPVTLKRLLERHAANGLE